LSGSRRDAAPHAAGTTTGWRLANGLVEVGVNRLGGQLGPVRFVLGDRRVEPMHRAPWLDEPGAADSTMLQNLQGDFFCAPFGENDLLPGDGSAHGLTANGAWREVVATRTRLELELDGEVLGARVRKEVSLRPGEPVVYQIHRLEGGEGSLPLGHHAMLRAPEGERLELSFSPWTFAGTPPQPVEGDASRGRSLLRYPQQISDLSRASTADGATVDLSSYPALDSSEEIVMLVTDPRQLIGWSAAVAPESGWIWFGLRANTVLRNTLLWLSNGGRGYPPFLGRHRRVLGIEEVTSYFHLGHRASTEPNELSRSGMTTSIPLQPAVPTVTRYAFGVVQAPSGFRRVATLSLEDDTLLLADEAGRTVAVPFDTGFLNEDRAAARAGWSRTSGPPPTRY
jgi:hypothetical protein